MNITATDKVLLGITAAITTVLAAVVHLWLALVVLVAFAVAAIALKHFASVKVRSARRASPMITTSNTEFDVINPATGLPMAGTADLRGNLYAQDETMGTNIYGRHQP
jgi:hypothetical protein